ncbi:MAG: heavy metal response regulator transcription factor [Tatlockia sp.]|nr:heavy metal response regulator transcription factor [Tatlockia sp.]
MRLLIIEDEIKTAAYLEKGLKENGFIVNVAHDGREGLFLANEYTYDLVILDVMLPVVDGWTVIKELKKLQSDIRILFLTAKDGLSDKIKGFELGADDYLIKPFAFSELLARINALLRRHAIQRTDKLTIADLEIDQLKHKVLRNNQRIDLTSQEFKLLVFLVENKGKVLSRTLLAESVWGINFYTETNVVDVAVKRLRHKIDADFEKKLIYTLRGRGYYIDEF